MHIPPYKLYSSNAEKDLTKLRLTKPYRYDSRLMFVAFKNKMASLNFLNVANNEKPYTHLESNFFLSLQFKNK